MSDDRAIATPAPADRPTFKILVDGAEIDAKLQVQAVVVTRSFNRVSDAEVRLFDGDPSVEDFPASSGDAFVPGGAIEIFAGYHGNEDKIFAGIIVRHGVRAYQSKPSVLRLECRDAAVKLTVGRKSAYYYDAQDAEVIEELAAAAGLTTDVEAAGVVHPQMVQHHVTDWDFIVTRAEANGQLVTTRDGELAVKTPDAGGAPVLTLAFGGNVLDFEAVMDARHPFAAVAATAWDAAGQAPVEAEAAAPPPAAPGDLTADDLAAVIGLERFELRHGGALADGELQAWADGRRRRAAFAQVRGRVRVQGTAAVVPGDVVELKGVGARFSGKALVSGVRHEIDLRNWETDVTFGLDPTAFAEARRDVIDAPAAGLLPAVSGLHVAQVTALAGDPAGEDRVQVRLPLIDPAEEGTWARVATLDAGAGKENGGRGCFFRPEVGDEVVLGYLDDDPRHPVILGMLNSSALPAPLAADDANPEKGFVTREGLKLIFNDADLAVTVETPAGNKAVISDADEGIAFEDQHGNKVVTSAGGITVESAKDLVLKAAGDVRIEGANVFSAASAQLTAEGGSAAELSSGGSTVVKGSVVQIN